MPAIPHKYLAYDYAAWIDPKFKKGVYTVLDAYFCGDLKTEAQWKMQHELQAFALKDNVSRQLGSFHGKGLYMGYEFHRNEKLL